jgi:hypothetical protein
MNQSVKWNESIKEELGEELVDLVASLKSETPEQKIVDEVADNLMRTVKAHGHKLNLQNEMPGTSPDTKAENSENRIQWISGLKERLSHWFIFRPIKLAASLSTAVAIAISFIFVNSTSNLAFAAVVNQLQQVSSMHYSGQMKSQGQPLMDIKVIYRQPGQVRIESQMRSGESNSNQPHTAQGQPMSINILDVKLGKGVILFPHNRMAVPFSFDPANSQGSLQDNPMQWYETLKNYQGEPSADLGLKDINGVQAHGFLIKDNGVNITVWASTETALPITMHVAMDEINGVVPFELDAELTFNEYYDDALFSLDISSDYQQRTEEQ